MTLANMPLPSPVGGVPSDPGAVLLKANTNWSLPQLALSTMFSSQSFIKLKVAMFTSRNYPELKLTAGLGFASIDASGSKFTTIELIGPRLLSRDATGNGLQFTAAEGVGLQRMLAV